jgi:hypothetical protein
MVPNSPKHYFFEKNVLQRAGWALPRPFLFVFTIIFHKKKYFFKQIKYVELTRLLGGSMLSWSVVYLFYCEYIIV